MSASYFVRRGDAYEATPLTRGPWDPGLQHAGPAAALLAGAVERHPEASGMQVARLTLELLRPLPVGGTFTVTTAPGRAGRKVRGLEASLALDGRPVARATALLVRRGAVGGATDGTGPALPPPEASARWDFPFFTEEVGYHRSMELLVAGGRFGSGHMAVWFRLRVGVVDGEEPSPLQRLAAAADSGNGVSVALDLGRYTFVNPDLTIALLRPPRGEWFALDARTLSTGEGAAISDTQLSDETGVVGRAVQVLLVEERPTPPR